MAIAGPMLNGLMLIVCLGSEPDPALARDMRTSWSPQRLSKQLHCATGGPHSSVNDSGEPLHSPDQRPWAVQLGGGNDVGEHKRLTLAFERLRRLTFNGTIIETGTNSYRLAHTLAQQAAKLEVGPTRNAINTKSGLKTDCYSQTCSCLVLPVVALFCLAVRDRFTESDGEPFCTVAGHENPVALG